MSEPGPSSCASCHNLACAMSFERRARTSAGEATAFVLDEVWPEFAGHVARTRGERDVVLTPGLFGRALPARYRWPLPASPVGTLATLCRHVAMRRVARSGGGVRQRAYLEHDRRVAEALARHIPYRARHLVVSQTLLPWLEQAGVLGGRTVDVLMTRYPLRRMHAMLDEALALHGDSHTLGDFRAPDAVLDLEDAALDRARSVVTPHHGIADLFGNRARRLDWDRPTPRPRRAGTRVAFLGPTIGRAGAYEVRDVARRLDQPLIVMGSMLEDRDFWSGIAVERRATTPDWLDDIGTILSPALATHQPRRLLEALAHGIHIFANPGSGLPRGSYHPMASYA